MKKNPLVSVVVVTYNSSKYIVETLESIKAQTYQNIELIITDDCSTDSTIDLCEQWIQPNENRFIRCNVITSKINTGIGKNCNRGFTEAMGEWIKIIAGDDALMDTCIEDYISIVQQHTDYSFFHSLCDRYKDTFVETNKLSILKCFPNVVFRDNNSYSLEQQYRNLLLSSSMNACTMFYHTQTLKKLGWIEEKVKNSEDWPTWIKIVQNGYKFYFVDKVTVKYRISATSIYSGSGYNSIFPLFYQTEKKVYELYIKEKAPFSIKCYWNYVFFIKDAFVYLRMTKKNFVNETLFRLLNKVASIWRNYLQLR